MTTGRVGLALIAVSLWLAGATISQSAPTNPAVRVVADFTAAYNAKDVRQLVSLYAPDALMVSEGGSAEGRERIEARLSAGMQRGNTIAKLQPEKSETSGDLSYTEGTAEIISGDQHLQRHYVVIVRTTDSRNEIVIHYSLPSIAKSAGP
jgi:ketosteroid isomerase-like protein